MLSTHRHRHTDTDIDTDTDTDTDRQADRQKDRKTHTHTYADKTRGEHAEAVPAHIRVHRVRTARVCATDLHVSICTSAPASEYFVPVKQVKQAPLGSHAGVQDQFARATDEFATPVMPRLPGKYKRSSP